MSKFSNSISVYKGFGDKVHIEINISLYTSNCRYGNLIAEKLI
jgi:hypothetical protein